MTLKTTLLAVAALLASMSTIEQASAELLTFDDLGAGPAFFTSNYQGFQFGTNNIADTAWFHSTETSPFYRPRSGSGYIATDFQLYNDGLYDPTQAISRSNAFIFDGAYCSGDSSIGYQLLAGNTVVYTSTPSAALTSTPAFVASGYTGFVNSVVIYGQQGFYVLDDFTFRNVATTTPAVPEPSTWLMMLTGFGLVAGAARYRRRCTSAAIA